MIISEHMSEDGTLTAIVYDDYKVELLQNGKLKARLPCGYWNAEDTAEDWCIGELKIPKTI